MPTSKLTVSKRVATLEQEIAELKALLKEQVAKSTPVEAKATAATTPVAPLTQAASPVPVKEEGISPEIMAVISAAVTHFLGLRARIRHARVVQQPTGVSPWAQQGRVFVQASHNLAHR